MARRAAKRARRQPDTHSGSLGPGQSAPAPQARLPALQRGLGNAAFARMLSDGPRPGFARLRIQRHPPGDELPNAEADVVEITEKETAQLPPGATRTADEEKTEKEAASAEGKAFVEKQKGSPGAMSLAGAEKILQGAYGGFKKIVPGKIEILKDVAAVREKYDDICIAEGIKRPDGSDWKKGDTAKDDAAKGVTTEGFAWKGVVYVNGQTSLVTATAHEILHNNTEPNFRAKVGETFNEGVTETLARKALTDAGITVPATTAYPTQVEITKKLTDLVGLDCVTKAYFGDVEQLVTAYEKATNKKWIDLKTAAEALDKAKVDEAVQPKPIGDFGMPKGQEGWWGTDEDSWWGDDETRFA
jgi:hypothetical protein